MANELVSCEELAALVAPRAADTAVLVLWRHAANYGREQVQLVTWGRTAPDKSEAHNFKEWLKDQIFEGAVPAATVHESFILDAAKNKERLDDLLAELEATRDWLSSFSMPAGVGEERLAAIEAVIRKAKEISP